MTLKIDKTLSVEFNVDRDRNWRRNIAKWKNMSDKFDIDRSPETPELLAIAEKELRETPEIREKGLAELRKLLKETPDLVYTDDDEFLTIILRTTHWYPESAIKLVN